MGKATGTKLEQARVVGRGKGAIDRIASRRGRGDDEPNIELAQALAADGDGEGLAEIAAGLAEADPAVASDCVKVLYEVGYRDPSLIAPYVPAFVAFLGSRNNRLAWGAAIALAQAAPLRADYLFGELDAIESALERGSVITVDNCVSILAGIAAAKPEYREKAAPILLRHLAECRPKDLPQHAERASVCMDGPFASRFAAVLDERRPELSEAQRKRLDKLSSPRRTPRRSP
jgi:DNA-binding FrmR family transcriptional regulator